jgi:hypothetical protein
MADETTPDSIAASDDVALTEADLSNVSGAGKFVEEITQKFDSNVISGYMKDQ